MKKQEIAIKAIMLAQQVKSIASRIEFDMKQYDCRWPKTYIEDLRSAADEILKMK